MSEATQTSQRVSRWREGAAATLFAFCTYFCMYAFRKPFAAASFEGDGYAGVELKTVFVVAQVVGYTASKYLGVRIVSEVRRRQRLALLVGLILTAELALVLFGALPKPLRVVAIALNGLPLGMVWGLVVRYLEGRRTSELLLAGLSCSFIVASGVVKDVGRWVLEHGVSEYWMPAAVGAMFLPAFVLCARMLDTVSDPDVADQLARSKRSHMTKQERRTFVRDFAPGLVALLIAYFVLTAFRDFRDNYGAELIEQLGYASVSATFSRTEIPVAVGVLLTMAGLGWFQGARSGLIAVFSIMTVGLAAVGLATAALDLGWLGGQAWMVLIGLGAYLAYVPFSSFLFDRIMAATRHAGTAVFAVNLADAIGYTGSVALLLFKDFGSAETSRLDYFRVVSYALALGGCALLVAAAAYFLKRQSAGTHQASR